MYLKWLECIHIPDFNNIQSMYRSWKIYIRSVKKLFSHLILIKKIAYVEHWRFIPFINTSLNIQQTYPSIKNVYLDKDFGVSDFLGNIACLDLNYRIDKDAVALKQAPKDNWCEFESRRLIILYLRSVLLAGRRYYSCNKNNWNQHGRNTGHK